MITKMKKIIIAISLIGFLQACTTNFVELSPKVSKLESNAYNSEDDAFLAMTSVYDVLAVQNWIFAPIMSDIKSDDAFCGGDKGGTDMIQFQEQEQFNISLENEAVLNMWSRCYSGIYRANLFLEKAEVIQWKTEGLKNRMISEVKFLRAYFYWDLVRHFGWVPIITTNLPSVEDYKNLLQAEPMAVYTQIATDLLEAEKGCPATVSSSEIGRVTKYAVQSLMTRIYLYYQGFAKPVFGISKEWTSNEGTEINKVYIQKALKEVVNSGAYSLLPSYADAFSWANDHNTSENIFTWQYSEKSGTSEWATLPRGWNFNGNFSVTFYGVRSPLGDPNISPGWSLGVPTWNLYNEFEAGDPRLAVSIYNANDSLTNYYTGWQNTGYFNAKFMPNRQYEAALQPNLNWSLNYPDIRFADVLLLASEIFLTDDPAFSLQCFNKVRTRALGESAAKGSINLDDIYHERRVELSGEGHRYWDLLRRGFTYAADKINGSFQNLPAGLPNESEFAPRDFNPESYGMFPIPITEIRNMNANTLKQFIPSYQ
jgi:hypothetical protein